MAGPTTEVLNDDIKELSRDLASFREDIVREIANAQLATAREIASAKESTAKAVGDLRSEFSEFRGRVDAHMRTIAWVGGFVATAFLGTLGATLAFTWQASALNSKVDVLAEKVGGLAAASKAQDNRIDRVEKTVEQLAMLIRMDRITPTKHEQPTPGPGLPSPEIDIPPSQPAPIAVPAPK